MKGVKKMTLNSQFFFFLKKAIYSFEIKIMMLFLIEQNKIKFYVDFKLMLK